MGNEAIFTFIKLVGGAAFECMFVSISSIYMSAYVRVHICLLVRACVACRWNFHTYLESRPEILWGTVWSLYSQNIVQVIPQTNHTASKHMPMKNCGGEGVLIQRL